MSKAHSKPTTRQLEELKTLQAMPDDKIDYSDIPATQPEEWRNAVVGKFYKPIKQQLTVRIDADVIAWLKTKGKGYQTRINQLLREAMGKEAGNH
jgi:uncharacterized protein (DUF4415 family)